MTGFLALDDFSPFLNLLVGLFAFIGIFGSGLLLCRLLKIDLKSPWLEMLAVALGVLTFSLCVQLIAIFGAANKTIFSLLLGGFIVVGCIALSPRLRNIKLPPLAELRRPATLILALILLVAVGCNLLIAMSGSTKMDEMAYHMLLPSRIAVDERLVFYRSPWLAGVLPQMIFQLSLVPLHSIGFPHAGNIVSWCINILFLWFAFTLIRSKIESTDWAFAMLCLPMVGMLPVVHYVTGGAHSLGDMITAVLVIALSQHPRLIKASSPQVFAGMISILAIASGGTKISLLPLAGCATLLGLYFSLKEADKPAVRYRVIAATVGPWLVFYLPILITTFILSGSPFGPILAGKFGSSVYDLELLRERIQASTLVNRANPWVILVHNAKYMYSPLTLLVVAAFFVVRAAPRAIPTLCFVIQLLIIIFLVPRDFRFFGGVQIAIIVLFGMYAPTSFWRLAQPGRIMLTAAIILLLPWLGVQAYYSLPFARYVIGVTPEHDHYRRYIAFYEDYKRLDDILPVDAALFVPHGRINNIYSPRAISFNLEDLEAYPRKYVFASYVNDASEVPELLPPGIRLGKLVYENPMATVVVSRIPGQTNTHGLLHIYELIVDSSAS